MEATAAKTTKRGCPVLRGQVLWCIALLLYIASASGRPQRLATKKRESSHLSFHKEQDTAAVAASPNDLSVPGIMQLTPKSNFQPGYISYDKVNFLSVNKEHHGDRRTQNACDTELTAFYGCLPDDTCQGCYQGTIQAADEDSTLCLEYESFLCASHTACPCGSGCESQAELLFRCAAEESGCPSNINCADTACDAEFLALANCDSTLDGTCLKCVIEAHDSLFPTITSMASCSELEDAVCLKTCGCDVCSDAISKYVSCVYTSCTDIDCLLDLDPVPTPTPALTSDPTPTLAPTIFDPAPAPTPCDLEEAAFYGCLPDETCQGCYQGTIQAADEDSTLCLEYESFLCASHTSCPCGSGCQAEAEILFQCAADEVGCSQTVNCNDTTCELETVSTADCVSSLDNSCLDCVYEALDALFPTEESTTSCMEIEKVICQAPQTCGCDYCSDKVGEWYSCLYSDQCPPIECRTPSPTMAPIMLPAEVEACYVCGNRNLTVDPSKMLIIDGESRPCGNVQEEYESTPVTAFECNVLIDLVEKSCGCQAILPPTVPPTSLPMQVQEMSSSKSNLTALSALVAIPLLAAIVYLMMRRGNQSGSGDSRKASRNTDALDFEFNDTPPVTPTRTTPSRRRHADQSNTESSEEDYYIYSHNHGGTAASHNSGPVTPPGNSIQSGGERMQDTEIERGRGPPGIWNSVPPHMATPLP